MVSFVSYTVSEFRKTKRLKFRIAHVLIPVCVDIFFLWYYRYSVWDSVTKIAAYFQVLSMGFPFLISLFCTILTEQESSAGSLFHMLSAPQRGRAFLAKLLLLILCGGFSVLLACSLFAAGYDGCGDHVFYAEAAMLLWGGSMPLYICHMFLSLRFPKAVSLGVGITESLLAALMVTSLGDMIWKYIPCAWSARWITQLTEMYFMQKNPDMDFHTTLLTCAIMIVVLLFLFRIFSEYFEGAVDGD